MTTQGIRNDLSYGVYPQDYYNYSVYNYGNTLRYGYDYNNLNNSLFSCYNPIYNYYNYSKPLYYNNNIQDNDTHNNDDKHEIISTENVEEQLNSENEAETETPGSDDSAGSFGGAVATGAGAAVIGVPGIQKGLARQVIDSKKVKPVTEMFWGAKGASMSTAAGQKLWKECPNLMLELQGNLNTLNLQYSQIAAKNPSSKLVSGNLGRLNKIAEEAIRSGNPDRIAQANEQIAKAANAGKGNSMLGRFFKRGHIDNATIKCETALKADVTNVAAKSEKGFFKGFFNKSLKRGIGSMAVLSVAIDAVPKLARGEKVDWKETGVKAGLSSVAFCVGEKVATKAVGKLTGKAAGKIAGKVTGKVAGKVAGKVIGKIAGKCAGKAIGAAIGSIIPGIGTAIGFIIGCVADWAINKYVIPRIFPEDKKK